jgi:phosphonopyruvate decarboxylase
MINPGELYDLLKANGVGFFVGVPDSLLANFCAYIQDNSSGNDHIIAANEGNAVAMAGGYYMATRKIAAVYMQNSGLGNAINPISSLMDLEICNIPMLIIIGWRGEPGYEDEPQHIKQGKITIEQLELLGISYQVMDADGLLKPQVSELFDKIRKNNGPVALVIKKNTFESYKLKESSSDFGMAREAFLDELVTLSGDSSLIVSTTGKTSRELFEIRSMKNDPHTDFLTVGAMGHTSSIAAGVAIGAPDIKVICLDGDGSLLMHMGAIAIIGNLKLKNFIHVLLNNSAHESVGGQPTVAKFIDFKSLSVSLGYSNYFLIENIEDLRSFWNQIIYENGPSFVEAKISIGSRPDLGRPNVPPEINKMNFMEAVIEKNT